MNVALVLSGGTGSRLGEKIPKQYIKVEGRPVIVYCLETLHQNKNIDAIQIVAEEAYRSQLLGWLKEYKIEDKFKGFSAPGQNRQGSILNGLCDIAEFAGDEDTVLIHDAARPLLKEELINKIYIDYTGHDGVLPVLPMKDTVYLSNDGDRVTSLLDRKQVFAGQAPELFKLKKYLEANKALVEGNKILHINGSTEPAIMAKMDIAMIPGDEGNFKITTMADLENFKRIIKEE